MPQPPPKPRRPAPDPRGLPIAREDIVPGIPRQALSPRAMEAAREAVRGSHPEVQEARIEALQHRMDAVEGRVDGVVTGQDRLVHSVDKLVTEVSEWKLKAASGEAVKIQEEQKTKRWVAVIGLLTLIATPILTATVNYLREPPVKERTIVHQSSMQKLWEEKCTEAPSDEAWNKCIDDIAIEMAPRRRR